MLTRDDVAGVHGVLVLDESKPIHEFDLGNFTRSMGGKVAFDVGLSDCGGSCCQYRWSVRNAAGSGWWRMRTRLARPR